MELIIALVVGLIFGKLIRDERIKNAGTKIEDIQDTTDKVDESKNYSNRADELLKFKQLFDEGVISEEELEEAKKEILSEKSSQKESKKREITCKKCGGTNFIRKRSTGGIMVGGLLAPKTRAQCQTCGFKNIIYT